MTGMNELHDDPKVSEEDTQSNARNLRWLRRLTVTVVVMSILGVAAAVVPGPRRRKTVLRNFSPSQAPTP